MPAAETTAQYLDCVRRSGLIEMNQLEEYLKGQANMPADAVSLARVMIRDGLLTRFQAEQLMVGRTKNFILAGKYKILERIGQGGMATVFLSEHLSMKRPVALKVVPAEQAQDPEMISRFYREARVFAQLKHENIVGAYDVDSYGDLHFLVTEYVDGASLQEIVRQNGPLSPIAAAHYIQQAAEGLQHAHESGLVHRDIKPSNIMVDRSGQVKLLDLGLSRLFSEKDDGLTNGGNSRTILGTVDYIAPEQALDSHDVDIRADIYALGGTFYYLLTGKPPFEGQSSAQKLACHLTRTPEPIEDSRNDLPKGMAAVIERMMAKDRDDRYQTPAEVAEALAPWTQGEVPAPETWQLPKLSPAAARVTRAGASSVAMKVKGGSDRTAGSTRTTRSSSHRSLSTTLLPRTASWRKAKRKGPFGSSADRVKWAAAAALVVLVLGGFLLGTQNWSGSTAVASSTADQAGPSQSKQPIVPAAAKKEAVVFADATPPESLARKGTYKPLDLSQVANVVSTKGMFYDEGSIRERLIFPDWSPKEFEGVPFQLVDPQEGDQVPNVIVLYSNNGPKAPTWPKSVSLACHTSAKRVHLLSGISAWGAKIPLEGKVTLIVRLHYADGTTEDHPLRDGIHFVDYIDSAYNVPESKLAFKLREQQVRYLSLDIGRTAPIERIELLKGEDNTSPIVMAVTLEVEADSSALGLKFATIPAGEFLMGSDEVVKDPERLMSEQPTHRVKITKAYQLSQTEVTVGQFRAFVDATGYKTEAEGGGTSGKLGGNVYNIQIKAVENNPAINWKNPRGKGPDPDDFPVTQVSWNDATRFCRWLSEKEGIAYRLPTEAEWEYACRAGSTGMWCFGDNPEELADYAWFMNNSNLEPHPVGGKKPNRFGLYDMHGSVWEWTADASGPYSSEEAVDPTGLAEGDEKIVRGGGWDWSEWKTRSAQRNHGATAWTFQSYGFRVCRPAP